MVEMKLPVHLLLFVAACQAAKANSNKQLEEKTEKRELTEGNAVIEKRTPLLPTASPATTGRIEYADSKNTLSDKSPTQQIYATPVPQIAKISDLLTGQSPSYQNAIASHLFSPVSIYQTRFGPPTTYEVSAPVPSNLAYTEHRLSLPSSNSIQYNSKQQKSIVANYEQPQVLVQQSYEQNLAPIQQLQQVTSSPFRNHQQSQQIFANQQQLQYIQDQPNQQQLGIAYRLEHQVSQDKNHQPEQRDLKSQPAPLQLLEKQQPSQQIFNDKQQNALSYARFTFNQAVPSYDQNQLQQVHQLQQQQQPQLQSQQIIQQPQQQQYQQSQQQLIESQPQQYQLQSQPLAQINYQLQHTSQHLPQIQHEVQQQTLQSPLRSQIQLQTQPQQQIQYQEQPQYVYQQLQEQALNQQTVSLPHSNLDQSQYQIQPQQYQYQQPQLFSADKSESLLSKQSIPERQTFYKQLPIVQPKLIQPQIQNLGYHGLPASLPTFPPVQYFGKFAPSVFSGYQQQLS